MKIVFALDYFPPKREASGGRATYYLAKELMHRGHQVFVITSVQEKDQEGVIDFNGVKVYNIYSNYHDRWRAWISLYNPQTVFKFKKIIKEIGPDVVNFRHVHQYLSYHCFKIAKKYAKAVFLTANDVMLFSYEKFSPKDENDFPKLNLLYHIKQAGKRYNPLRNIVIRHYLKYIDEIFSISNTLKKLLMVNGIKNVTTIYNSIDPNDWQEEKEFIEKFKEKYNLKNKKTILFGGRLGEAKGGEVILRAMKIVTDKIDNAVLIISGNINKYAKIMTLKAKELSILDKIIFTGFLRGGELRAAYYGTDVFVFPSLCFEALGMTILEVMACKKAVIGTCFGGTPEMIKDGKTGYVINPYHVETMANKIIDLLKNPQKEKDFGVAGYDLLKEKFSVEENADKILEQYLKFL